jgi:hypothetical protein
VGGGCGRSEKQLGDVIRVYEVQYPRLDQPYLNFWSAHLGVADLLAHVRTVAAVV